MKPTPEQREKQPTKPIDQRIMEVANALTVLSWMPKYPAEPEQFNFFCRALAKFIQTVDRCHWNAEDPEWNEKYAMGWVNPLAWVVEQVGDTREFFPPPLKWREIYCTHWPPLDHKRPNDLYAIVPED